VNVGKDGCSQPSSQVLLDESLLFNNGPAPNFDIDFGLPSLSWNGDGVSTPNVTHHHSGIEDPGTGPSIMGDPSMLMAEWGLPNSGERT
jgi:hypothetical protein